MPSNLHVRQLQEVCINIIQDLFDSAFHVDLVDLVVYQPKLVSSSVMWL